MIITDTLNRDSIEITSIQFLQFLFCHVTNLFQIWYLLHHSFPVSIQFTTEVRSFVQNCLFGSFRVLHQIGDHQPEFFEKVPQLPPSLPLHDIVVVPFSCEFFSRWCWWCRWCRGRWSRVAPMVITSLFYYILFLIEADGINVRNIIKQMMFLSSFYYTFSWNNTNRINVNSIYFFFGLWRISRKAVIVIQQNFCVGLLIYLKSWIIIKLSKIMY